MDPATAGKLIKFAMTVLLAGASSSGCYGSTEVLMSTPGEGAGGQTPVEDADAQPPHANDDTTALPANEAIGEPPFGVVDTAQPYAEVTANRTLVDGNWMRIGGACGIITDGSVPTECGGSISVASGCTVTVDTCWIDDEFTLTVWVFLDQVAHGAWDGNSVLTGEHASLEYTACGEQHRVDYSLEQGDRCETILSTDGRPQ